jgi:hypothetical protein
MSKFSSYIAPVNSKRVQEQYYCTVDRSVYAVTLATYIVLRYKYVLHDLHYTAKGFHCIHSPTKLLSAF